MRTKTQAARVAELFTDRTPDAYGCGYRWAKAHNVTAENLRESAQSIKFLTDLDDLPVWTKPAIDGFMDPFAAGAAAAIYETK